MTPRNTKRADRRALIEAGKAYHTAKLAYGYVGSGSANWGEYADARAALVHAAEEYVVGRRKASVAYGQRHYAKQKKAS